jgi:TonB family protein
MKPSAPLASLCCALFCATFAHGAASDDARARAYQEFRGQFDARHFAAALPAAQQVVQLSEQQFGADQPELIIPLLNLGTTQLRLTDYPAAQTSFQRAVKIVEAREGGFSRDIIHPLLGLGVTYAAAGQRLDAIPQLRRAIDVSRKLDGLFNLDQLELLEPLIESYIALEQNSDAEREQQYTLRLAETAYGKDDLRILPTLERNAHWYEESGRYLSARQLQIRAIEIVRKNGRPNDLRLVDPLRGIARSFRLELSFGPEITETDSSTSTVTFGAEPLAFSSPPKSSVNLDTAGKAPLEAALKILKQYPDAPVGQRADTLLEMGDWHLLLGEREDAVKTYKEAWRVLTAPNGPGTAAAFGEPRQLYFLPPIGAHRRPPPVPENYEEHFVDLEFTVSKEGRVGEWRTVEKSATEAMEKSTIAAIKKARYRPRFVEGEPAETAKVRYRQTFYVKRKS